MIAYNTVCPHLGCFVDYRKDEQDFFCPCHDSNFDLEGNLLKGVSPRAMDTLKWMRRNQGRRDMGEVSAVQEQHQGEDRPLTPPTTQRMEHIKKLYDWLDNRTGIRSHIREVLFENVPGGSRWRYVWGSTLLRLMIQFITGIFLWMGYSPSGQTAWESVYYINNHMTGGTFCGFASLDRAGDDCSAGAAPNAGGDRGAYRAPREVISGLA